MPAQLLLAFVEHTATKWALVSRLTAYGHRRSLCAVLEDQMTNGVRTTPEVNTGCAPHPPITERGEVTLDKQEGHMNPDKNVALLG